jgi:N-methylhydantoinase B/oxoprolinase/acetone carboxylase alpha subunit
MTVRNPVCNPLQNVNDLKAQIAANEKGAHELRRMAAFCKMNSNLWSFGPRQSIRPLLGV